MYKPHLHPTQLTPNSGTPFENFYKNVAAQLDVDPECVIRVALGEQRSRKIEMAMERELKRIVTLCVSGRNGHDRRVVKIERTKRDLGLPTPSESPIFHAGAGMPLKSGRRRTGD
jgi:hypothetical protein